MKKILASIATLASFLINSIASATPAPVQIYYLPIPENDSRTFYNSANTNVTSNSDMRLFVTMVTGASNGIITIDHWEDGFEADITNPLQSSTEIYGDGNLTNGVFPAYPTDIIPRSANINVNTLIDPDTRDSVIDLDGQDKIATTVPLAVTILTWPTDVGTVMADATEILSTQSWGTTFTIPVDHTHSTGNSFTNMAVEILAMEDGTTIEIDGIGATADGSADNTQNLNEGEAYLYYDPTDNGTSLADNLFAGAKITSNKPIQVIFMNAERNASYESRWYYLYPDNLLSDNYYNPVSTPGDVGTSSGNDNPTAVFIHNINNSAINVTWERFDGTTSTNSLHVVPANSTIRLDMPDNHGSRFYTTTGDKFAALALIDSDNSNTARDWGFTLIPEGQLRSQSIVGLGLGHDPTISSSENGSPVFLLATYPSSSSSTGSITVCIDLDGDGAGPLTDSNNLNYDLSVVLDPLEMTKVYDPDGDQSGMFLYVCDGSDGVIATAWGQHRYRYDAGCNMTTYSGCSDVSTGSPAIDSGTAVPGFPSAVASKSFTLTNDLDGDGYTDLGETITYSIKVDQAGNLPVPAGAFTVFDDLPVQVTYVPGSTEYTNPLGVVSPILDDGVGTPFPLDALGYPLPSNVGIDESAYFTFDVIVTSIPAGNQPIINRASLSGSEEFTTNNLLIVPSTIGDRIFYDANKNNLFDTGEGINGVTLTLRDSNGVIVGTDTTALDGEYLFEGLPPDTYTLEIDSTNFNVGNPLESYATQIDPDNSTANQVVVVLDMDEDDVSIDYAYAPVGIIIGTIFKDLDNGSDIDLGEGTNLVTVELLDDSNNVVDTTTTDASGNYTFSDVVVGDYTVRVASANFGSGQPLENFSNTFDPDGGYDNLGAVSVTYNNTTSNVNFGYQDASSLGVISGTIFNDINTNNTYNAGEEVNNVLVELLIGSTVVDTTTSNSSGVYSFTNLAANTYTIRVVNSNFNTSQPLDNLLNSADPDSLLDNQTVITLSVAELSTGNDFGYASDQDNDTIPDPADPDDDNDGIPDTTEGPGDTDGDTIPDSLDPDSDNDGINDVDEGSGDTDSDGTPDFIDPDSDNDGIPDTTEGPSDTDSDGTPNYKDLDSDNDGIPDQTEGTNDFDNDGTPNFKDLDSDNDTIPDTTEGSTDKDGDGKPNYLDLDSDNDGLPDSLEGTPDTDGDGKANYLDIDADADGITDMIEAQVSGGTLRPTGVDANNNGWDDAAELAALTPVDTDLDGKQDYVDVDSDNDTIPDATEGHDVNHDRVPDVTPTGSDTDGDGLDNAYDTVNNNSVNNPVGSNSPLPDNDNDTQPDWRDTTSGTCTSLTPLQISLDGSAYALSKQLNSTLSYRKKLANNRTCSAVKTSDSSRRKQLAKQYFEEAWHLIWTLPQRDSSSCVDNASTCTIFASSNIKSSFQTYINRIATLSEELLDNRCVRTKGGRTRAKHLASISALKTQVLSSLGSYPDNPLVCN